MLYCFISTNVLYDRAVMIDSGHNTNAALNIILLLLAGVIKMGLAIVTFGTRVCCCVSILPSNVHSNYCLTESHGAFS
jgi:hypothetical protein